MTIRSWSAVVLLLAGLVLSGKVLAEPQLPQRTGSVVDLADLLEPFQEQPLATRLETLKARNGVDFVVVTLPSLQADPIETWGQRLGNGWNVGGKSGLGALLIVAPNDREVRIEIGDALAVMFPDSAAASIIADEILPNFRDGRLAAGILAGADAMIYQVTKPLMATDSSGYSVEGRNYGLEDPSRFDLSGLRSYLPSQGQVLVGIVLLLILFALYKSKFWHRAFEASDFSRGHYSDRTVYRDDQGESWHWSSWHRDDREHDSGGFGGLGSSRVSSSSSRSSGFSGSSGSPSSGGFSGSGSSRSFGGSSSGRSGRGASGRW